MEIKNPVNKLNRMLELKKTLEKSKGRSKESIQNAAKSVKEVTNI